MSERQTHKHTRPRPQWHTTQYTTARQNILEAKVFVKTASWCCCASEPNNTQRCGTVVIRWGVYSENRWMPGDNFHKAWLPSCMTALWGYTRNYTTSTQKQQQLPNSSFYSLQRQTNQTNKKKTEWWNNLFPLHVMGIFQMKYFIITSENVFYFTSVWREWQQENVVSHHWMRILWEVPGILPRIRSYYYL